MCKSRKQVRNKRQPGYHGQHILLSDYIKDWEMFRKNVSTGREIAPNTGANVTKCLTLATKS